MTDFIRNDDTGEIDLQLNRRKTDQAPSRRESELTVFRGVVAAIVIASIAAFTFLVASRVEQVPVNTHTIEANCEARNRQITRVNAKFAALDIFIEAAIAGSVKRGEFSKEALRLFKDYKQPVPTEPCASLVKKP